MNNLKKAVSSTKKFVVGHQTAIMLSTAAIVCLVLNKSALRDHDNFLKEHGLYDEFYSPNE